MGALKFPCLTADYLLCGLNSPSSSSTLELRQGFCFQEFGLKIVPCISLHVSNIDYSDGKRKGKDVAGRNEHGVGRRKLSQVGRNVIAGVAKRVSVTFNSSSENHLILMPLCYLSKSSFSVGLPSSLEKTGSLQNGRSLLKPLYYWK